VTLSDLAKYSMTRSIARPLCDSWASCDISCGSFTNKSEQEAQLLLKQLALR